MAFKKIERKRAATDADAAPKRKSTTSRCARNKNTHAAQDASDTAMLLATKGKFGEESRLAWLASLPVPVPTPTQEDLDAAQDVMRLAAEELVDEGKSAPEPSRTSIALRPFAPALVAAVGAISRGCKVADWERIGGLSYTRLNIFAKMDKDGFGRIWNLAWRVRREGQAARVREKAVERVTEGDAIPITGRVGLNQDGIIGERRQFSDKLTEYLIDEAKPAAERVSAKAAGPSVTVGQIVYNFPDMPPEWLGVKPKAGSPVVDVTVAAPAIAAPQDQADPA